MIELSNIGLTDIEIENIINICPEIKELSNEKIFNSIKLLKNIECNDRHIRNIIATNPYYLIRDFNNMIELINKLIEIKIKNINLLFDSNPYFLNNDSYEIDDFIYNEQIKGKNLYDIIDEIENNPYIIDEK